MAVSRMRRVDGVLREVIGGTIGGELQDSRIGLVIVTAVQTSPDLRTAQVHVSVLGSDEEKADTMAGLRASHGVIQKAIASQLRMKRTPTLTFVYDESVERADRITRMLDE